MVSELITPIGLEKNDKIERPLGGRWRHGADDRALRWNMDRHEGFATGKYLEPCPLIFTRHGHNVWMGDMYRGGCCFLILGGPSLNTLDLSKLNAPGVLTCGINNSPAVYRPDLWISLDNPENFLTSIWQDNRIQKFVPLDHKEKRIYDVHQKRVSKVKVGDCPNTFFWRRNEHFKADQFLFEDTVNWGCQGKITGSAGVKGSRSVMLSAVRILFYLGVRRLFLLGADFSMAKGKQNYAFDQGRSQQAINNNNATYDALNKRFDQLRPYMEKHDYKIYNCYPDSGLKSFDFVSYENALDHAAKYLPDVGTEKSAGLYDRKHNEKEAAKDREKVKRDKINKASEWPTLEEFLQR